MARSVGTMQVKTETADQIISQYLEDAFALHPGRMTASGLVARLREAGFAIIHVPEIALPPAERPGEHRDG